jgi:hypothetical protein
VDLYNTPEFKAWRRRQRLLKLRDFLLMFALIAASATTGAYLAAVIRRALA